MPQPPTGRPSGGPPANRPSTVRQPGAAQPAPPSQRVARPALPPPAAAPAPARPSGAPGTQRVAALPPAAKPAGGPASQKVPALGAAARPASPGTQRISKPAAPAPGGNDGAVPPSSKSIKTVQRGVPAPMAPAARVPMTRKKLILNLCIWLSIPICIAVISIQVYRKGLKGVAKNLPGGGKDVGKPTEPVGPQLSPEQIMFDEIHKKYLVPAETKFQLAELKDTPHDKKIELWKEVVALDMEYVEKMTPLLEDKRFQGEGWGWLSDGMTTATMRLRLLRDRIRETLPPEEVKAAEPNTRALGAITSWNGTKEKFAVIFLPKDASPKDPAALAAEFPQTLGLTGSEIKELPPDRIWEQLLKGDVRKSIEDMQDAAAKKAKCEELAKGVQVFEGQKFSDAYGYLRQINGYYYKDQLARVRVSLHDDRGNAAFKEYYDLILLAIGTPAKGFENIGSFVCEWKLVWRKDGVVYRLSAIGPKTGMDLAFTAYNEANWKALAEERGDKDVFDEAGMEDWGDRAPKAPPAEAPK